MIAAPEARLRRTSALVLACSVALALWGCGIAGVTSAPARSDTILLRILHTNDVHAHLLPDADGRGGWASICALIKARKAEADAVIALDAGDMTQGTPVSSLYHGVPIFHVMNACGYDAAVLGNHEFDNGLEYLGEFRSVAEFPLLSANVRTTDGLVADAGSTVLEVAGVRVGLLGLTTQNAIHQQEVSVRSPVETAREALPELGERADLIVALTHLGHEAERALAESVDGIDLIVGGHSHTALPAPVQSGSTWIVQAGEHGHYLGELEVTLDARSFEIRNVEGRLIEIPQGAPPPDPAALRVVEAWEARVGAAMEERIGSSEVRLEPEALARKIEQIWRETYQTDFAYQNPGGTRSFLPAGDIRVRDVWTAMPFDNTLAIVELDRARLERMIPGAQPPEDKPLYRVLTNSYVADRLVERFGLPEERRRRIPVSWRDPVLDYIRKHGGLP